jgi:stearoyl-CoA desaturase (delta-9 desaturase)
MKKPPIILLNSLIFAITGSIAFIGVPLWAYFIGFSTTEIAITIILFFFTGISITAGYHRLWSHKTYKAHPIVKVVLAVGGAMTVQNSILHWASDHRVHHRHVDDNDKDPYSAKKGFWYSHIGWMLREYQAHRYDNYENCRDLQKDKVVMWQHNHYIAIVLIANFGITALLGWLNGSILGMILLAGVFRLVAVHHVTFFINSLAHLWGKQPYTENNTAKDNGVIALFTFGEGYHNYHHIFEYDYRNGIRWWQYDPTKWVIRGLSFFKLTWDLRRTPEERIEKAQAEMQFKLANKRASLLPNADEIKQLLQTEYDILIDKMSEFYLTKKRFMAIQKRHLKRNIDSFELNFKYKELKQTFEIQKQKWLTLHKLHFIELATPQP